MIPEDGSFKEFKRGVLENVRIQRCEACGHPKPLSLDDLFWEEMSGIEIGVLLWCEHCHAYETVDICGTGPVRQ
jgi:hypothetical protein